MKYLGCVVLGCYFFQCCRMKANTTFSLAFFLFSALFLCTCAQALLMRGGRKKNGKRGNKWKPLGTAGSPPSTTVRTLNPDAPTFHPKEDISESVSEPTRVEQQVPTSLF